MGTGVSAADSRAGWLSAVLPVRAQSFRVTDDTLAAALVDAGGRLTETGADVEITEPGELLGDAAQAIVSIDAAQAEGGSLLQRAPRRVMAFMQARNRVRRARHALRAQGYAHTSTLMWDIGHVVYVPWVNATRRGRPLAQLLPQRAVVAGSRGEREPTMLEGAVRAAEQASGDSLTYGWPLAGDSGVVVVADNGVVNVVVGPGRLKIEAQRTALEALQDAAPIVTERLPRPIAAGRAGLAHWSLESRLRGVAPRHDLSAPLLGESVAFLAALHEAGDPAAPHGSIAEDAEVLAELCVEPANAERLRELGAMLERSLEAVPRGFGHGDFWTHNMLVENGVLVGVIDWDGAGSGRLPLLDLFHLLLSAQRERTREYVGEALVGHLLPWARAGGDETVELYTSTLGIKLDRGRLEELVLAYWLDRMALEVRRFADRADRPFWVQSNVECVIEALAEPGFPSGGGTTPAT